jgi:hypothetical protein
LCASLFTFVAAASGVGGAPVTAVAAEMRDDERMARCMLVFFTFVLFFFISSRLETAKLKQFVEFNL